MKPTYLEGIKDCEAMYKAGYSFVELKDFIKQEDSLVDYRWVNWVDGFTDAIKHFEKLDSEMSVEGIKRLYNYGEEK